MAGPFVYLGDGGGGQAQGGDGGAIAGPHCQVAGDGEGLRRQGWEAHRVAPFVEQPPLCAVDPAGVFGEDGLQGGGNALVGDAQRREGRGRAGDDLRTAGGGGHGRVSGGGNSGVVLEGKRCAIRPNIVSEQGKPPDFILEVASESTGATDTGAKRQDYAALGISEYWRFDETGQHHGVRLAGDQIVGDRYRPITIEQLPDGTLQGYSPALNLFLHWQDGQLLWIDPATQRPILTYEDQLSRAQQAAARISELENEVRRLRGQ